MEGLFTLFNSHFVILDAKDALYGKLSTKNIYRILLKHRLKIDTPTATGLTVFQDESPEDQWLLKAYLKLSRFLSNKNKFKTIAEKYSPQNVGLGPSALILAPPLTFRASSYYLLNYYSIK